MRHTPPILQLAVVSLLTSAISGPIFTTLALLGLALNVPPEPSEVLTAIPMLMIISGLAAFQAAKLATVPVFIAGSLLWLSRDQGWPRARLTYLLAGALVGAAMPIVAAAFAPGLAGLFEGPGRLARLTLPALYITGPLCGLIFRALMNSTAPFFGTEEPVLDG